MNQVSLHSLNRSFAECTAEPTLLCSFTEKDFEACMENRVHGMFRLDWSIYEWQEARRGDFFYMMRTGDDKAGIVFRGQFLSDPYPDDDWAGGTKPECMWI